MATSKQTKNERITEKFVALCRSIDARKSGEADKKMLQDIGVDNLRQGLKRMKLPQLYRFLRGNGYAGTVDALRDNLAAMGVRPKQETPEKLQQIKCRKKGCVGRLRVEKDAAGKVVRMICGQCGAIHVMQGRRVVLQPPRPNPPQEQRPAQSARSDAEFDKLFAAKRAPGAAAAS